MRGIKVPPQDFPLKMQGRLMREGGAYLRDTTVVSQACDLLDWSPYGCSSLMRSVAIWVPEYIGESIH